MMQSRKMNPRAEYRLRQIQRASDSVSLAEKFPNLKSLTVDLAYFEADGLTRNGALRYKVNLQHAKSVFSFVCPSRECFGGDFDLSEAVAGAVSRRKKIVEGERQCHGNQTRPNQAPVPCHYLLRYKLTLAYV